MQIEKFFAGVVLIWFGSLAVGAHSRDIDTMPLRATVEHVVPAVPQATMDVAVPSAEEAVAATSALAESIVDTAMKYLGARYRSGHSGPSAFDCSGFTSYVFKQENIKLTRSSRTQFLEGDPVASVAELRKGDLVFFGGSRARRSVGHVGIVTDVNPDTHSFKFIHAARKGVVVTDSREDYYARRYMGARRILPD